MSDRAGAGGSSLAIVLVHYHTPQLAAAAVAALRRDLAAGAAAPGAAERAGNAGAAGAAEAAAVEWLVVDNGSDAAGRELLASLPVRLIEPGSNLGFAGGVNLGVAESRAEHILLLNPDVEVLPGCVGKLIACLRAGAAAAGPRFYWDAGRRLLLPPAEERGWTAELRARLAALRGGRWAAAARRRSRWHCRAHWQARAPLPSPALSGSLLAVRRAAWRQVGGFDEGYRLYFEETDWLLRLRRAGLVSCFVPDAEAVHLYGRSAAAEPRARAWFEESARRFRRRHYGAWFDGLLGRLGGAGARAEEEARVLPPLPAEGLDLGAWPRPLWVEVSPNAAGFPAAAERIGIELSLGGAGGTGGGSGVGGAGAVRGVGGAAEDDGAGGRRWRLPAEVGERLDGGPWWVTVSDDRGRDLARFRLAPPGSPPPPDGAAGPAAPEAVRGARIESAP